MFPKMSQNSIELLLPYIDFDTLTTNIILNCDAICSVSVQSSLEAACGRAGTVIDSHTTGSGFKTRLVLYFLSSFRLITT